MYAYLFAESVGQDPPVHTNSLILLYILRRFIIDFRLRNR